MKNAITVLFISVFASLLGKVINSSEPAIIISIIAAYTYVILEKIDQL